MAILTVFRFTVIRILFNRYLACTDCHVIWYDITSGGDASKYYDNGSNIFEYPSSSAHGTFSSKEVLAVVHAYSGNGVQLYFSGQAYIHSCGWEHSSQVSHLGGLFPVALLLPLDETETADEANSWTAMMQTGGFIMGGLLPLLIAVVYDWTTNHQYTFVILTSLYLMMFVLTFLIGDKKELAKE